MRYRWDKVIGSLKVRFATKDRTVKKDVDLRSILLWWKDNHGTLKPGTYHLTEWASDTRATILLEIEI